MSIESIRKIKKTNIFMPLDLIIYTALALLILILFWVFIFGIKKDPLTGIEVYLKKDVIFSYDFNKNKATITKGYENNVIITKKDGKTEVKILSSLNDYNIFIIESKPSPSVYMYEADCFTKDCMLFKPITKEGDVIICKNHWVKIIGLGDTGNIDIGVG